MAVIHTRCCTIVLPQWTCEPILPSPMSILLLLLPSPSFPSPLRRRCESGAAAGPGWCCPAQREAPEQTAATPPPVTTSTSIQEAISGDGETTASHDAMNEGLWAVKSGVGRNGRRGGAGSPHLYDHKLAAALLHYLEEGVAGHVLRRQGGQRGAMRGGEGGGTCTSASSHTVWHTRMARLAAGNVSFV